MAEERAAIAIVHPWDADRPLPHEAVRATVHAFDPGLADLDIVPLGHGWDFDAFRVGDRVFRFPRRADVAADIGRRTRLGPKVAERLRPLGVSVPVVEAVFEPGAHFPYRCLVSAWVPGIDLNAAAGDGDLVARRLGRVLSVLHATTPEMLAPVDLPHETDNALEWLAEARAIGDGLRVALGEELASCADWLEEELQPPPPYEGPSRLLHDDLGPEHVLVDERTGELCGLLDWDDAAWGDPALDFVVLRAARGPHFTEAMLEGYDLPLDPGFRDRVSFMARVEALDWVHDALLQGGDLDKHRGWVRRAFTESP